jgi:murein L,D-transpeptidase YafK
MYRIIILVMLLISSICSAASPTAIDHPRIVITKKSRQLVLFDGNTRIKTYRIGLGLNPGPPKMVQGDRATPEGEYEVCEKNPASRFHMALVLNYPNSADAERGLKSGLISKKEYHAIQDAIREKRAPDFHTKLGGEVEIHGMGSRRDWTWGCIALENSDIEELYRIIPKGTRVSIRH